MSTILGRYQSHLRITKSEAYEEFLARDESPGYDETGLVRATKLSHKIFAQEDIRTILEYESQVAIQLQHRFIVQTQEAGPQGQSFWFVQELNPSETLRRFFSSLQQRGYETLTIPLALAIASAVADAAHAANVSKNAAGWSLNVVHGGIDFETIQLGYDGTVGLGDFGLAKALRKAHVLKHGQFPKNRLGYFSPECVRGRTADTRSDTFSIGVVLWELLTGRPAFGRAADPLRAIVDETPQPPSSYNAKVTPTLDQLVMRAIEKDPDRRFKNCEHFNQAVLQLGPEPGRALERVPRILDQLFGDRSSHWNRLEDAARDGDATAISTFGLKLFGDDSGDIQHSGSDAKTSPRRAPIPSAATKADDWDEAGDHDSTTSQSAPDDLSETVPGSIRADVLDTLVRGQASHEVWHQDELGDALDSSISGEDPEMAPELANPAVTHVAYKPTPMPDVSSFTSVHVAADDPIAEPSSGDYVKRSHQDSDDAAARAAEPDGPLPEPERPSASSQSRGRPSHDASYWENLPPFADEEEDDDFTEPFSVGQIVEAPELVPGNEAGRPVLEIIRVGNGRALDIDVFRSFWHRYRKSGSGVHARKLGSKATLKFKDPVEGWVRKAKSPRQDINPDEKLVLEPGDAAKFVEDGLEYHVRVFRPPIPPARQRRLITPQQIKLYGVAFALSLVFHGLGMLSALLTSYLGVNLTVKAEPEEVEIFAEGTLEKEKPKEIPEPKSKPKPKPKPKPRVEPKPPADPTEAQAKIPKSVRQKLDNRLRRKPEKSEEDSAERLLGTLTTPQLGDGETVKDVVTNIDAPGTRGGVHKTMGTLKNIEGEGVNIATSSGGKKLGDIGGSVSKDTGKLDKREKSGKVRGQARGLKGSTRVKGTLSRNQVYEVIQKYQGQIQRCYERELTRNPGLAGRISFMWSIKTNGRVSSVREQSNSMGNSAVSKCISGVIRKMKFPNPKGGEAEVVFPWIFKSI